MDVASPPSARLESVDVLRGIVMILMALDHVRDYLSPGVSPTNLEQTTVALFFTRWVTHLCAPVFFLLTGTGAYLALRRRMKSELSRFLFTRGLWLIFLEIVVLRCFALQFNFDYRLTMLVVIWALGWAMIVLAGLVFLPAAVVIGFGAILILGHNLLDSLQAASLRCVRAVVEYSARPRGDCGQSALHGVCGVSVDSVGGRDGDRLCAGCDLWVGARAAQEVFASAWDRVGRGIRRLAGGKWVWGSGAVEPPEVGRVHGAVVFKYDEISAIAVVSADDAGAGDAAVVGLRPGDAALAAAGGGLWACTSSLLLSALVHDACGGDRTLLRALQAGALDVRVAGTGAISDDLAAGMGLWIGRDVFDLGAGRGCSVSGVPVVCGRTPAAQGTVAELFIEQALGL